jgi:hypothetical protein
MRRSRRVVVSAVFALATGLPAARAQSVEAHFFGGAGDQRGSALSVSGGALFAAGWAGSQGLVVRYPLDLSAPVWSVTTPASSGLEGIAVSVNDLFGVGTAFPPACGAADGTGGTEWKVGLARMSVTGAVAGCQSSNFWVYRGTESYFALAPALEGTSRFFYAGGVGENCGNGHAPFLLAKYTAGGTMVDRATEPGVSFDAFNCLGGSGVMALHPSAGYVYTAGYSQLTGQGEDNTPRPTVMKYDAALDRVWKVRDTSVGAGILRAVAVQGESVYAAGYVYTPNVAGSEQYLLQRYDLDGNLIWSRTWGTLQSDFLNGVAATPLTVYVVGSSNGPGLGGADAVIQTVDAETGAVRRAVRWGGAQDDFARAVAVSGPQVFVVGESRSFAVGGNTVGQNDMVVMRYRRD